VKHELKNLASLPEPQKQPARKVNCRPGAHQSETVVNSQVIQWKPCDRVASRVVAKARWYEKPPQPEPEFMKPNEKFAELPRLKTKRILNENGVSEEFVEKEGVAVMTVADTEHDVRHALKVKQELLDKAKELDEVIKHLGDCRGDLEDDLKFFKAVLEDFRQLRMALASECKLILADMRDTRKFFLEDDYKIEIARMGEFLDVSERLQSLMTSGFLDLLVPFMLNLSSKTPAKPN
jgi:hypothetical protein